MERLSYLEGESRSRMRLDSNPLKGSMAASLAAGPIFSLLSCLDFTAQDLRHGHLSWSEVFYIWYNFPYLPCWLACFILTIIPNTIGSITLGMLGTILPEVRLWPVWPIAGGGLALLALFLLDGRTAPHDDYLLSVLMGAACAGTCRLFTHWQPI